MKVMLHIELHRVSLLYVAVNTYSYRIYPYKQSCSVDGRDPLKLYIYYLRKLFLNRLLKIESTQRVLDVCADDTGRHVTRPSAGGIRVRRLPGRPRAPTVTVSVSTSWFHSSVRSAWNVYVTANPLRGVDWLHLTPAPRQR